MKFSFTSPTPRLDLVEVTERCPESNIPPELSGMPIIGMTIRRLFNFEIVIISHVKIFDILCIHISKPYFIPT